jgi:hypothetical protein
VEARPSTERASIWRSAAAGCGSMQAEPM